MNVARTAAELRGNCLYYAWRLKDNSAVGDFCLYA